MESLESGSAVMAATLPLSLDAATTGQRVVCSFCGTRVDPAQVERAEVPSNVRAFKHEVFHVWRCPTCRSLHCLEAVDLRRYYTNYPIVRTLTAPARMAFENLLSRLTKHGYAPGSRLLDYGCGWGTFLEHLRERGYHNAAGYDPYSGAEALRDPACLQPESFDYIVLQDVVEHVEDARVLFSELNTYLKPGGYILVGTPTADDIRLSRYITHWTQLHLPYHLHIYTRAALEKMGAERDWSVVNVFDRPYYDTKHPGLNARALNKYQWFGDGTLDACFDVVPPATLRRSIRFMSMAYFGYWLKRKTGETAIMFQKPDKSGRTSATEVFDKQPGRAPGRDAAN